MRSVVTCCVLIILFLSCNQNSPSTGRQDKKRTNVNSKIVTAFLDGIHDQVFAAKALELLEITENYTPATFESRQKQVLPMLTTPFRKVVEENLNRRINENKELQSEQSFTPDKSTVVVEKKPFASIVMAKVTVDGNVAFKNKNKTWPTRLGRYRVKLNAADLDSILVSSWTLEFPSE